MQKLLDDRGLYDQDACIFISMAGSNALNVKNNREIYRPLFEYILKNHPVFMVVRESRLTQKLCEGCPYEIAIECLKKNKYHVGFRAARKLLKDFGLSGDNNDYRAGIAQKHYCELVLADIQEENWQEQREIYKESAVGVLNGVLKAVREYDCCRENEYVNSRFTYYPECLAEKVKGVYKGGMVGKRGGLTAWDNGQRVGWAAIDFPVVKCMLWNLIIQLNLLIGVEDKAE